MKYFLFLMGAFLLTSCADDPLVIDNGNDVELILDLKDHDGIEKIEFTTRDEITSLNHTQIADYDQIIYNFNILGEDAVSTCIYTDKDTICHAEYVELNYKPHLVFEDNELTSKGSLIRY
ncbi:hypothetical protein GO491_05975 [Flavobacteriaceae bacterium Ap0902]|nr:hypothetical protein [Flavobacteriaceae bacterium Ap0902]